MPKEYIYTTLGKTIGIKARNTPNHHPPRPAVVPSAGAPNPTALAAGHRRQGSHPARRCPGPGAVLFPRQPGQSGSSDWSCSFRRKAAGASGGAISKKGSSLQAGRAAASAKAARMVVVLIALQVLKQKRQPREAAGKKGSQRVAEFSFVKKTGSYFQETATRCIHNIFKNKTVCQ